jgi:hypothetical protein
VIEAAATNKGEIKEAKEAANDHTHQDKAEVEEGGRV